MGDSQDARITYRLYIDDPDRDDRIKDVNRKLRAVEVICRDQRVSVSAIKDKSFDDYLQAHPLLMKLNQTLEARDD